MLLFSDVLEKNKRVFKVPVYQRNYDWTDVHCKKLFSDIMEASEKDCHHFTGTIVYISDNDGGSGLSEVLIIDGQQRITTLYILLKALFDASVGVSESVKNEIEEVMFNRHCDEKYKVKLKPVKSDNEQLYLLVKDKIEDMDRNSNVYKNYITYQNCIADVLNNNKEVRDVLNGIKKLEVVEIILDKLQGDEPQKIFESINSTGLELSIADKIRNYLLMDDDNQEELYNNYWTEIEKNVGYRNLEDFVINYINSKISKSVNKKNAYELFKNLCKEHNYSHETVLKELKSNSKCYGAFIGENTYYSDKVRNKLLSFFTIKQTTVIPLLFKIFNDFEATFISEDVLCNVLDYLLTYYVRITACEINKNLSKFMKSLYDRVILDDYDNYFEKFASFLNDLRSNDRMPTDKEFIDSLVYKPLYKKPICKYVLSVIENSTKEQINVENLTIEHILPQKENAVVWKKEVGEDYDRVYELYLHTLGNLTITGHNSELGTKPFKDKKSIIRENSKANILNKDVLSADRWNEDSILKRADKLSEILVKQFEYVDIHEDVIEDSEMKYSINSDISLYNTKPDSFSFIGEYVKVTSWVELLSKFIDLAYDLDSELFIELANNDYTVLGANRVYISNDSRKLRKSKQINSSGIFYETNLSSQNIISFVKNMMTKMNLENDDFYFYLSEMPFDINNPRTWTEGIIPVAKLFYNLMESLINHRRITSEEIDKLKTKDYTKQLFHATDYPAVANNRTDNMGNSTQIRYRKKPLKFGEIEIYISTQFFDSDRENIIDWYNSHE